MNTNKLDIAYFNLVERMIATAPPQHWISLAQGYIPLRFNSHRARERALGHRQLLTERAAIDSGGWKFRACYSLDRSSKGGFYVIEKSLAEEILQRNIPGVSRLRGPYNDLRWCW